MRSLLQKNDPYKDHTSKNEFFCQEIFFYVGKGDVLRNDNSVKESTAVKIQDTGNKELTELLTTGDGPLQSGAQPSVNVANESGEQELLTALNGEKVEKSGKPKKDKKERTDKLTPKTFPEFTTQFVLPHRFAQSSQWYLVLANLLHH